MRKEVSVGLFCSAGDNGDSGVIVNDEEELKSFMSDLMKSNESQVSALPR